MPWLEPWQLMQEQFHQPEEFIDSDHVSCEAFNVCSSNLDAMLLPENATNLMGEQSVALIVTPFNMIQALQSSLSCLDKAA